MSVSDNDQGDGFSFADKRLYKSFLKLFCNHLFEYDDGNLGINLRLETFGTYDANRVAIKQTLNNIIRAFGASVYFPRHRQGDVVEPSNEAIYLENTKDHPRKCARCSGPDGPTQTGSTDRPMPPGVSQGFQQEIIRGQVSPEVPGSRKL